MMEEAPLLKSSALCALADFKITCLASRLDTIAVGSATSTVLLFNAGEMTKPSAMFKSGGKGTSDLGFDASGDVFIMADMDGSVTVLLRNAANRAWETRHYLSPGFNSVPHQVAVDPNAYLKKDYAFACSKLDKLCVVRKAWLGSKTEFLLDDDDDDEYVNCGKLVWRGDLLAWTASFNSILVVHDVRFNRRVFRLELKRNMSSTHVLVWEDDETLLVGFGNQVGIIRLKREADSTVKRIGNVLCWVETPCALLYISPFGGRNGKLVLFGMDNQIRLVERKDGKVLCSLTCGDGDDLVAVCHDPYWHLPGTKKTVQRESELPFLYVATKSGALNVIEFRTREDCLQFALNNSQFDQALELARTTKVSKTEAQVLDQYVVHLIHTGQFELIPQVLQDHKFDNGAVASLDWKRWSAILAERRALHFVLDFLPKDVNPVLLDCVLSELLDAHDLQRVVQFVRTNLARFQSLEAVIEQLNDYRSKHPRGDELKPAVALCLSKLPSYSLEDAFNAMIDEGNMVDDALEVVAKLPAKFWLQIPAAVFAELFTVEAKARQLVLKQNDETLVCSVATKLQRECVNMAGAALRLVRQANKQFGRLKRELCDLEVALCSTEDPLRLMELLRDTGGYSPDHALQICRKLHLVRETVFLLQRIGGPKYSIEALELLLGEAKDVPQALEFAEREDLIEDLIRLCVKMQIDGDLLLELLAMSSSSAQLNPARLVRALPSDMPMEKLRPVLVELFHELEANKIRRHVANQVFQKDTSVVSKSMNRQFRSGVKVNVQDGTCALCGLALLGYEDSLVVFRTKHVYHRACLARASQLLSSSNKEAASGEEAINSASLIKHHCVLFGRN